MPRIINAFYGTDPLAETLSNVGRAMFGDTAGGAVKRAQQRQLERENAEIENLMGRVAGQGAQTLGSDPLTQAMIIGGGYDPAKFGQLGLLGAATEYGAADPRTDNFAVGTGAPYRDTSAAYRQDFIEGQRRADATLAETARQFNMKPLPALGMDGMPVWATQGSTADTTPILSDAERKGTLAGQNFGNMGALPAEEQTYLGADPRAAASRAPFNYRAPDGRVFMTTDAVTDVQSGQPLPPGGARVGIKDTVSGGLTNSVLSDEQAKSIDYQRMEGLLDVAEGLTGDPTRFGITGTARDYGQDIVQLVGNVSQLFGGQDVNQAVNKVRQEAAANGVANLFPELYDPTLPQVDTIWGLLVYTGAAALAGQSNRSVSDKDVQFFRTIVGDPKSFFASAETMRAKIAVIRQVLGINKGINERALGAPVPDPTVPPGPAAPAQAAPQAQPGAPLDWRTYFGK